jgi:hypothetical protein
MAKKIQIGDQVYCTHAASSWYKANKVYDVVAHPETGVNSVVGSDGLHDMLSLCVSKFEKVSKEQVVLDKVPK